jgi:hypothetical protein
MPAAAPPGVPAPGGVAAARLESRAGASAGVVIVTSPRREALRVGWATRTAHADTMKPLRPPACLSGLRSPGASRAALEGGAIGGGRPASGLLPGTDLRNDRRRPGGR